MLDKNTNLTEKNIKDLLMQLDQYAMVGRPIESSLEEIIEEYKERFLKDADYDSYYDFLSDVLEELPRGIIRNTNGKAYIILGEKGSYTLVKDIKNGEYIVAYGLKKHGDNYTWGQGHYFVNTLEGLESARKLIQSKLYEI